MSGLADRLTAIRAGSGLFRQETRGVLEVSGSERSRWLDGMVSHDVAALGPGAGCRALLLTRQGRITADLRILCLDEVFWLGLPRAAVEGVRSVLDGFIIADDVTLENRSAELERWSLDGAKAEQIFAATTGGSSLPATGGSVVVRIAEQEVRVASYSLTGLPALQFFAPLGTGDEVAEALRAAGESLGLVDGDTEAHECLRVEMGQAAMGTELDDSVLPAEARIDEAISETKGCYTGQEVVARMRSRGRTSHLLVGLQFAAELQERGSELAHEGQRIGEVTSSVRSPSLGAIGMGYVKAELAVAGTQLQAGGFGAQVVALPFLS
ncbi:MAG: aminomethyltransferase family protein [Deltaproteobacteria bacterium]|nr:aminomethyltransferase family protein [Deltaproteobacteria bacterium]MBW2394497.1 aminomethyltransferase family protein [Deltaproteobacteria bacterium]